MPTSRLTAQILSHLANAPAAERSGAGISKATRVGAGSLYPELAAMESAGLIVSAWDEGPEPRRRLYALTEAGRRQVGAMPAVQVQPAPGLGNWFWRTFVSPFFGG
ncbi:PadR family transcriptional regulator [Methylobacterium sp. NMS14P]|uniref:PadR family transcriptional regulator n=1 Tax=Methylobacterium sp. NMS14P TaxID=2894310 RepID=UPI002358AB05|nr:PadR family transcriptional regulator [Methylobacterium sp. NMS14P]WCS27211.1 PadR family transcriptional regulator [Methylobacterium sp. NMS14P]